MFVELATGFVVLVAATSVTQKKPKQPNKSVVLL